MFRQLVIVMWICFLVYGTRTQPFDQADLEFVSLVHRSFCGAQSVCTIPSEDHGLADNTTSVSDFTTTRNLTELPVPDFLYPGCCQSCSCNISSCVDFGNCCPDLLDRIPTVEEAQQPEMVSCQNMSLRAVGYFYTYWVYGLCSKEYVIDDNETAAEIKSKCENRESYFRADTRLPVTDLITQRVYANRFCAICHFVQPSDMIPLTQRLTCYKTNNTATPTGDIVKSDLCDVEFHWPVDRVSFPPPFCRQVETQCNTTGLWKQYDPLIEAACHSYTAVYNYTYNNIFCFLCNEVTHDNTCKNANGTFSGGYTPNAPVSFSMVIDFSRVISRDSDDVTTHCGERSVYDHYKGVCRDLTCTFPRILYGNQCINAGDEIISEVAFKLQLKFKPTGVYDKDSLDTMVPMIVNFTESLLVAWGSKNAVSKYRLFYRLNNIHLNDTPDIANTVSDNGSTMATNWLTLNTTTAAFDNFTTQGDSDEAIENKNDDTLRDTFVTDAPDTQKEAAVSSPNTVTRSRSTLTIKYVLWHVEWHFRSDKSGRHSPSFVDNVIQLDETTLTLNNQHTGLDVNFSLSITDLEANRHGYPIDPEINATLSEYPVSIDLPNVDSFSKLSVPIRPLNPTLVCPLIQLTSNELNLTERLNGLFVEELNATFDKITYIREDGAVNQTVYSVCRDTYISITDGYAQSKEKRHENGVTPQGVLSVICACISILCSFLTLLTYLLFRELRTQPGINNMFVCVNLICAQSFFTFATPQEDSVSEWACSLIGALTHFFWLMVVFAMNVCCYHMFTVFNSQSRNQARSDSKFAKSIIYTVYCVCSSLLFVVINIIVVFVDTDGEENGYGAGVCYISRQEMVGYVFALPVGIILLINIVFFVSVVVKINRSPTVSSSNKKDRNYFKIYAKLSTVTGITWIFGLMFALTGQDAFEYIFIVLEGGIGVLIFLSFVCNKRTYDLYKGKFLKVSSRAGSSYVISSKTKRTDHSKLSQDKAMA